LSFPISFRHNIRRNCKRDIGYITVVTIFADIAEKVLKWRDPLFIMT
jgi:hypothetical protein